MYLFFRERVSEGKGVGEKYWCVVSCHMLPSGNPACNPGTCPRLGMEPTTFWLAGRHSVHWAIPVSMAYSFLFIFLKYILLIRPLQLCHFPVFIPLWPTSPFCLPPLVHVHGLYICVLWLLHFLYYSYPPPVYFLPTIYASYSQYLSPFLPLPISCW